MFHLWWILAFSLLVGVGIGAMRWKQYQAFVTELLRRSGKRRFKTVRAPYVSQDHPRDRRTQVIGLRARPQSVPPVPPSPQQGVSRHLACNTRNAWHGRTGAPARLRSERVLVVVAVPVVTGQTRVTHPVHVQEAQSWGSTSVSSMSWPSASSS